ncbi:hypothetical protein BsWGS_19088 [Bradybaena similaris]
MTRMLITPHHRGDIRSRTSINRSVSINSIPSQHNYNGNVSFSPLSSNSGSRVLIDQSPQHHYKQHQQNFISSSTSNIASAVRETPKYGGASVYRSQSFGGLPLAANTWPCASSAVLGETMRRNPRSYKKMHMRLPSFRKSAKLPKVPSPKRAMLVFDSVRKGLGEFIEATHEDIAQLISSENSISTSQGRLLETDKKIKSAERYLKRLECHLAKIEELQDSYMLNQQLREGAVNMAKAFSTTNSNSRKDSISNIKYGYKECSQAMCAIEAQLESLLGTFSCSLNGIAGYARVVPGDVFEVLLKHGDQKWKTKGKIEKDSTQSWGCPNHTFKCLVGDMLSIKVSEMKLFKSVLLGQKSCEIWNPCMNDTASQGLFCARPQLMTVNINVQGSLKLSIIITWNPLDGVDEAINYIQAPIRAPLAVRKRPVSMISLTESLSSRSSSSTAQPYGRYPNPLQDFKHRDDSGIYGSATSLPSHMTTDSAHAPHGLSASPLVHNNGHAWRSDMYANRLRPYSISTFDVRHAGSRQLEPVSPTSEFSDMSSSHANFSLSKSTSMPSIIHEVTQTMVPGLMVHQMAPLDSSITVEEALQNLKTTLEDFLGHYPELQKLEDEVQVIEALVKKSDCAMLSIMNASIEGAIEEAFDFLNLEGILEDLEEEDESEVHELKEMKDNKSDVKDTIISSSSAAKTADSGIGSLTSKPSPVPASSGNEQVDQALVFHLSLCDNLLQNLGNFGPLKCREFYALDYLQKQAVILDQLVEMAKAGNEVQLSSVLSERTLDKTLREVWELCVDQTPLYAQAEKLISVLEHKFGDKLSQKYQVKPIRIFQHLMARMLYATTYDPEVGRTSIVTIHQFMLFFRGVDMLVKLEKAADELYLLDLLNAGTSETVINAIVSLQDHLPPPVCLKMLTKLLVGNNREVQQSASTYLKIINRDKTQRDIALVVLVEGLEDHITEVRAGCCVALSIFEAVECISQLVHLSQTDSSSTVRRKAKETLYSLGDVGRKAVEEAQLGVQGFQGLQMHKPNFSKII